MKVFFDETTDILQSGGDVRLRYAALRRLFRGLLDDFTEFAGAEMAGIFAQTDFLLKKHDADFQLRCRLNDARQRMQHSAEMNADILEAHFRADAKAVAFFGALLHGAQVPDALRRLLPMEDAVLSRRSHDTDYVRFIVSHADETSFYGKAEDEDEEVRVLFADPEDFNHFDWSYLRPLMTEGTQLNIVRPRRRQAGWGAGLIVLEPDLLIDVSSVAACFETYGATPLNALLAKVKPQESTLPILLGNLAGQMLDEEVRRQQDDTSYAESVREFFSTTPLNILATGDIPPAFHDEARRQQQILRRAMRTTLPALVDSLKPADVMLEPTFFSEMLGLQGRMDFLQLDLSLLIEQKSGKAAWPEPRDGSSPRPAEKHYVQMLLYMELLRHNFRREYDNNAQKLYAFLLYSRYEAPLVGLGFAPQLFFDAMRLRNGMAAQEMALAHDGFGTLRRLSADDFNLAGLEGKLWEQFQKPQIERVLRIARGATDEEWDYVARLLQFTAREHLYAKFGSRTKENSGFASKWHATLEEKLSTGDIFEQLTLDSPAEGHEGGVERVTFRFGANGADERSNFRQGDIVLFYPYARHAVPDVRHAVCIRGSIEALTPERLTILLRARQSDARVFLRSAGDFWAVEHDFLESSFTGLHRGIFSFLSAPRERRDLLLLKRTPRTNSTTLNGDYGAFNDLALRVKQADDFFLIVGPPGTGKTSFGMLNTLKEALTEDGASVLVLAYTNRAVDEICSKLVEEGLPFLRIGGRLSCDPAYHDFLLESRLDACASAAALRERLLSERVIVGTATALSSKPALLALKPWQLAIIDEASQLLEPHLLGLLCAKCGTESAIRKFVMIGDHKQLPAVVLTPSAGGADVSLFERLLQRWGNDPRCAYMLTRQGRMHEEIADFASRAFYENALRPVPLPHQQGALAQADNAFGGRRVLFFSVLPDDSVLTDKVNAAEAHLIASLIRKIHEDEGTAFDAAHSIGIIVPYRNQIAAVRHAIAQLGIPALAGISIDTVERYQGSQREHIIYGFTVKNARQMRFLTNNTFVENGHTIDRKLNVAMTRARRRLWLVGNAPLLAKNPLFARLIEYVKEKGGYVDTAANSPQPQGANEPVTNSPKFSGVMTKKGVSG